MKTPQQMLCIYSLKACNKCASQSYCSHEKHGQCQLEFDMSDTLHLEVVVIQQMATQQLQCRERLLSSWQQTLQSSLNS